MTIGKRLLRGAGTSPSSLSRGAVDRGRAMLRGGVSRSLIALLLACVAGPLVAVSSHASGGTNQEVDPRLECVEPNVPSVGLYTAHWGYENENSSITNIPIGSANKFSPAPIDRGQPALRPVAPTSSQRCSTAAT